MSGKSSVADVDIGRPPFAGSSTVLLGIMLLIILAAPALAQSVFAPTDTTRVDTNLVVDTLPISDSTGISPADADSAAYEEPPESLAIVFLPMRLADSLALYFVREWHEFDILDHDLYPRNAAGFLTGDASYLALTYHETPLRTTLSPYGLPGAQLSVCYGPNELRPADRTIPPDGATDYNDIATGNVTRAGVIEGPLAGFMVPSAGPALLYLELLPINDTAASQFTVERGAFGYAYTRGRIARRFSEKLGFAFSTDYRSGDGYLPDVSDNSYYVSARVESRPDRQTWLEAGLNVYRRQGDFPVMPDSGGYVFRRLRRDQQAVVTITRQGVMDGQIGLTVNYQASRSAYDSPWSTLYHVIRPEFLSVEAAYSRAAAGGIVQLSAAGHRDIYHLDREIVRTSSGRVTLTGSFPMTAGQLFFFSRLLGSDHDHPAFENGLGLSAWIDSQLKLTASIGHLARFPGPIERYLPSRVGRIGSVGSLAGEFREQPNPGLQPEQKLAGNLTLTWEDGGSSLSLALNGGRIVNAIYYDRAYGTYPAGDIRAQNDTLTYVDLNLTSSLDRLGPFFGRLSLTGRQAKSERYGLRSPYSPRWQTYFLGGLKIYLARLDINIRLFGDCTYYERPWSHKMEELNTGALITGGINASMKSFTFYYQVHDLLNQTHAVPEGYGYSTWHYSWGINWQFID